MTHFKEVFDSPYDDCGSGAGFCSAFNGKPFTVLATILYPDATHDAEIWPMYLIECDGVQFEAWPEEIISEGN